jgi:hypothetical protein
MYNVAACTMNVAQNKNKNNPDSRRSCVFHNIQAIKKYFNYSRIYPPMQVSQAAHRAFVLYTHPAPLTDQQTTVCVTSLLTSQL